MSDAGAADWEPDASDNLEDQWEADDSTADQRRSDGRDSFLSAVWSNLMLLGDRSLDRGVVVGFAAMTVAYWVGFALVAGGAGAAVVVGLQGAETGSSALTGLSIGLGIAVGLVMFAGLIAYQTLLIGLQRPMHNLLFDGPEVVDGVRNTLEQAVERFWTILGVSSLIGVVIYGGAFFAGGVAFAGFWGESLHAGTAAWIVVPTGLWLGAALAVAFVWGAAGYLAATRELGVVESLSASYQLVVDNLTEMLLAWGVMVGLMIGAFFVFGLLGMIPCVGQLVALPLQIVAPLAGTMYWAAVFATLESRGPQPKSVSR